MAEYISTHTGAQIDEAVSAVANKQDTLVSGTNIKTINQTSVLGSGNIAVQPTLVSGTNIKTINNNSILGEGNLEIQVGGGNDRIVDVTNPEDWQEYDKSGGGPTDSCIEDIATHDYDAIKLINMGGEMQGLEYGMMMWASTRADFEPDAQEDEEAGSIRAFNRIEADDEDDSVTFNTFSFSMSGDKPDFTYNEYKLGSGGGSSGAGIHFEAVYLGGNDGDEVSLALADITNAIDNGSEVIIRVNEGYDYPTRYFRIETQPVSKTYISGPDVDCWTPTFVNILPYTRYTMVFDRYESEAYIFKIYEGYPKFTPTQIDMDKNEIIFDIDDYSFMFNKQPQNITINLDENGGEFWVDFNKVVVDDTPGEESYTYTSGIIPISKDFYMFAFRVYMNGGNIETEITANQLTVTTPV